MATLVVVLAAVLAGCSSFMKGGSERANRPLTSATLARLAEIGSTPGAPMVIRVFKQEGQLEVWKQTSGGRYAMFKSYPICKFSGDIGPKFREGDYQSPEGFYTVTPGMMNPNSSYYLSFNVGFPNKFDRVHGRTGSNLMIHGDCKSVGCFAMTDPGIAEIYALARETFRGGNAGFQVQLLPFRMTTAKLVQHSSSEHIGFWQDIKEGYDYFEMTRTPPAWDVCEKQYIFNAASRGSLDAAGVCPPSNRSPELLALIQADADALGKQVVAAQRQADEQAAIKARGEAVNSAVSGFFGGIGNIFTGNQAAAAPVPAPAPVANP